MPFNEREHRTRTSEMSDGLLRQRRNLILVSVFHLLFEFGDIEFQKVGLLGTDLIVGRPETLVWFAWALWGYFLLRYWLYYRTERLRHPIGSSVQKDFRGNLARWAKATHEKPDDPIPVSNQPFWIVDRSASDGGRMLMLTSSNPVDGGREVLWSCPIPLARIWIAELQALAHVVKSGTEMTDYWLPFLLALAAPLVSALVYFW